MDKHLLRVGSAKRRSIKAAMTFAIKIIGDSLMQPFELNISPPAIDACANGNGGDGGKRRMFFRFPSIRKRSKSQGYIAKLGDSSDSILCYNLSSKLSIARPAESSEIKEFQRELINLPIFELDTHRTEESVSTCVSRFSSVPDQLECLHLHNLLQVQSYAKVSSPSMKRDIVQSQQLYQQQQHSPQWNQQPRQQPMLPKI